RLSGFTRVAFSRSHASVDRPWIERIPYQVTETYQEPYTTYESRMEAQTTYSYQSYTYPCGTSTCTGSRSVPQTSYVPRSGPVTHYRTATRTVTRYREEARLYRLEAERVSGDYASDLHLRIDLSDGGGPLDVRSGGNEKRHGLNHDVTYEPAGIRPERANLADAAAFRREKLADLSRELTKLLAHP